MSLLCRLKNLVHKGLLRKEDLDRIVIIPKGQENKVVKMREATPEERGSISKYINNMSKLTGVSFENLEKESCKDTGELSDGYHTFNQLYHQRAVLFACIVRQNKNKSWKSFKHSDGKYCFDSNGEWFIVGIDTPQGSYTYHYAKEYWDMFDCQELECGKEWDGHTEKDVTRLLSLEQEPYEDCISRSKVLEGKVIHQSCDGVEIINGYAVPVEYIEQLPPVTPQSKTGRWTRMSDLSEQEDDRYQCSRCKNVVHHKNKMDLYTFNSWCGRCGSNNGRN